MDIEKATSLQLRRDFDAFNEETVRKHRDLEEMYKGVSDRVDSLTVPAATGANSSSAPAQHPSQPANCNSDVPYELRTCAKIGNFPYDTPKDTLVDEASKCLLTAGVDQSTFKSLHAVHAKGSWVLLTFVTPQALQAARLAISAANYEYGGRKLWCDAAKTRAELLPARLIHRCFTALSNEESSRPEPDRLAVEKVIKGKQVKLGGKVFAFTRKGELYWTSAASERYSAETLQMLKGWIEAE